MEISSVARKSYDHRLKNSVACSGNSNLFPELAIPKRTTSRWASVVRLSVVTASEFSRVNSAAIIGRLNSQMSYYAPVQEQPSVPLPTPAAQSNLQSPIF